MRASGRYFESSRALFPVSVKATMVWMPSADAASTAAFAVADGKRSSPVAQQLVPQVRRAEAPLHPRQMMSITSTDRTGY
jgi:hypothetical protein